MKRKPISELYFIRAIACISVVAIHALTMLVEHYSLPEKTILITRTLQMVLLFATPMFVLISEFILSYAYPGKLPKGFYKKRFMYIFLPYIMMGLVYAVYNNSVGAATFQGFLELSWRNLFQATWHGYFIIIIFQFYFLHSIFNKFLSNIKPWLLLSLAFIINAGYLYTFSFIQPPELLKGYANDIWFGYSRLPFMGWIFYFTLAYYGGRNIPRFKGLLNKYQSVLFILLALAAGFVLYNYHSGTLLIVSSRRVDIMIYTVFLFVVFFYFASKIKRVPGFILKISQYSFAIYLLHPLVQMWTNEWLPNDTNIILYTVFQLGLGIAGSIFISSILNKLPLGYAFIGKLGKVPLSPSKNSNTAEAS